MIVPMQWDACRTNPRKFNKFHTKWGDGARTRLLPTNMIEKKKRRFWCFRCNKNVERLSMYCHSFFSTYFPAMCYFLWAHSRACYPLINNRWTPDKNGSIRNENRKSIQLTESIRNDVISANTVKFPYFLYSITLAKKTERKIRNAISGLEFE